MAVAHCEPEVDPVDAKKLRKAQKRLAKEVAEVAEDPEDAEEAKRRRKAERKATKASFASNGEAKPLQEAVKKAIEDDDEGVPVGKSLPEPAMEVAPASVGKARPEAEEEVTPAGESGPLDDDAAEAKKLKAEKRARLKANKAKKEGRVEGTGNAKRGMQDQGDQASKEKTKLGQGSSKAVVHKFGDDFKVFVRGLPWSIDEDALQTHFKECGDIENVLMPKTPSGSSRGVGFIKFKSQEGFDAALNLDGTTCGGRTMNVATIDKRANKGQGKEAAISLPKAVSNELTAFIRGLPFSADEALLRKDFEECGAIDKITLPKNAEGKPKGICFIKFLDAAGVAAALKFDNTEYGGRTIHVHTAEDQHMVGKGKDGKGKGKDGKSEGKDSKGKGKGKGKQGKGKDNKGASTAPAAQGKTAQADSDDVSDDE